MASASYSQRGQNDPFDHFGDDLEMVWVVMTIMVMEEASVVMVVLVAAVVVVVGLVTVGMPVMDSVMTEAVVEVVGARIVWAKLQHSVFKFWTHKGRRLWRQALWPFWS